MYYPSAFFRLRARRALKGRWQTALLIALVVNLPTLLIQGISAFTGNDLLERLESVYIAATRDGTMTAALLQGELDKLLGSTVFWVIRGAELAAWLITPFLSLGMYKWLIDRLHGQDGPVGTVFCRAGLFFRAIGLQLLIILKVLLWMLPGIGLMTASILLLVPKVGAGVTQIPMGTFYTMNALTPVAIAAIAVPGIMAALRYGLAEFICADEPEMKIRECVRKSIRLTKGYRKNLFLLMLSFLLWYLAELFAASLLAGMGGVVSLVFQMFCALALHVYTACSVAAFYLLLEKGESPVPEQTQSGEGTDGSADRP